MFSIPGVWPFLGMTKRRKEHYYNDGDYTFPPAGHILEVAYYSQEFSQANVQLVERENGDIWLLAWLLRFGTRFSSPLVTHQINSEIIKPGYLTPTHTPRTQPHPQPPPRPP